MTDGLAPAHLIDTNILLRISRRDDPDHAVVDRAVATLAEAGAVFYYTHQNVTEFWNVAKRPANLNGFGLSAQEADRAVRVFEKGMTFLPDNEEVYLECGGLSSGILYWASKSTTPGWLQRWQFTRLPIS